MRGSRLVDPRKELHLREMDRDGSAGPAKRHELNAWSGRACRGTPPSMVVRLARLLVLVLALVASCMACAMRAAAQPEPRISAVRLLEMADPGAASPDEAVAALARAAGRELARLDDAPAKLFEPAWFAIRLERGGDAQTPGFLRIKSQQRREIDAWLLVDGRIVARKAGGYARVAGADAILGGEFALPLAAWIGREAVVILRSVSTEPLDFDPFFAHGDQLHRMTVFRACFVLFFAGVMTVFIGFQLIVFMSLRERAAIDYALFCAVLLLVILVRPAFLPVDLSWGSLRLLPGDFIAEFRFLTLLAGLRMVESILDLQNSSPRLWTRHRLLLLGSVAIGLPALALGPSFFSPAVAVLLILASLWSLVVAALSARRGVAGASWLLVGFSGLIGSVVFTNLYFLGILDFIGSLEFFLPLGVLWHVAFGALALGRKFAGLREERHRAELRDVEVQGLARLVRVVCHDVSSPLMRMKLLHERLGRHLESGDAPHVVAATLRKAMHAAGGIAAVIAEVRNQEMLREGDGKLPVDVVDVAALARDALAMSREQAASKGVAIREQLPASAFGRANAMVLVHSVLGNLLSNAIKFSPPGGEIRVEVVQAPAQVGVRVSDAGPGMPAETIAALERSAMVASRLGTSGERGAGFGLGLARDFTVAMGGALRIEPREAHDGPGMPGTTVTVWLAAA